MQCTCLTHWVLEPRGKTLHVSLYAGGEIGIGTSWWTEKAGRKEEGREGGKCVYMACTLLGLFVGWLVG